MKIFAKSILDKEQIKQRKSLNVDGIELLLNFQNNKIWDLVKYASDNFDFKSYTIKDYVKEKI